MKELLNEGGVAGHMNHLYDNPNLTFKKMKQVLQAASNGELKGTEKTDGQNIYLSYDIRTAAARASRNQEHIKDGGLDAAGLADFFAGRGEVIEGYEEVDEAVEKVNDLFSKIKKTKGKGDVENLLKKMKREFSKLKEIYSAKATKPEDLVDGYVELMEDFKNFERELNYFDATDPTNYKGFKKILDRFLKNIRKVIRHPSALEIAFNEAFAAFEETVGKLSIEEREEIFGPNTNVYYNAEVQDPRAFNVINYDLPTLTIHRAGHDEYDRETGKATGRNVSKNARKLDVALDRVQGTREEGRFFVQMNAIRSLEALSDDTAVNLAIARLEKVLSDAGISDNQTVGEYMVSRVEKAVDQRIALPEPVKVELMKRLFKEKGASITKVLKMVSKEDAGTIAAIRELVSGAGKMLTAAIAPVEEIIHDFAVEMLRGLHSAFILNNEAEVERLRAETSKAIQAIEGSGSEEAMEILTKQMGKLKDAAGVTTAAEGFVFDFDGVTYKFTGNFAPMNQLLGLFKYGRGNVPPLQKLDEEEINVVDDFPSEGRRIALVPGAFKPPHRGHLEMVQHYADMADQVVIMVSPLPRKTPSGKAIGFEASKAIWEIYLRDAGLQDKVSVIRSPVNSPVLATYQFVENKSDSPEFAQPGDIILPGCSTKGGDQSRFKANFEKYAREGVRIADYLSCAFEAQDLALSATDFRKALDAAAALEVYIPPNTDPGEVYSVLGASPQSLSEVLTKLVEEVIDEMSSMAGGSIAGGLGAEEEGLIREEEPEEEDDIITEVFDYLVKKGALS